MELFWCDVGPWLDHVRPALRFCAQAGIQAGNFLCQEDLVPHAAGRFLLEEGFGRRCPGLAMPPITADGKGKPRFLGEGPFFSISHAGRLALCAMGDRELGVDVELAAPVEPALLAAMRPAEREYIARRRGRGREEAFYRVWTRRESLVKATGEGLGAFSDLESVVTPALRMRRRVGQWYLCGLALPVPGYVAAAALAERQEITVTRVDLPLS